jgi:hypothetical protein
MELTAYLDQQLRAAGIPIVGVRILAGPDRTGWIVEYLPSATPAQKATAANLLASVTIDAPTFLDADAKADLDSKVLKAIVVWCAGHFGISNATARAELIAIYKGLP